MQRDYLIKLNSFRTEFELLLKSLDSRISRSDAVTKRCVVNGPNSRQISLAAWCLPSLICHVLHMLMRCMRPQFGEESLSAVSCGRDVPWNELSSRNFRLVPKRLDIEP